MKMVIIFILVASSLMGQESISYAYDAAGNRILKETLSLIPENDPEMRQTAEIGNVVLSVFPNPTAQLLEVNIEGFDIEVGGQMELFNAQGQAVLTMPIQTQRFQMDVSHLPSAIYHLKIAYGESIKAWSVTKID